ncbi:hypothetical protein DEU56DRAFT_757033 [Suillus clintonianus]|uniref:uncharacterized protein n=1 Tax=Suillus clintonianus TaxID=1904413 RepID=UPI001B867D22|nr:uncharacterized protein DEU56DRAFT_757033 [Suillus clintonianus]KAG2134138.1 hypothetical protein DEU56DRAFT_757033 [Suillus clintonianus]
MILSSSVKMVHTQQHPPGHTTQPLAGSFHMPSRYLANLLLSVCCLAEPARLGPASSHLVDEKENHPVDEFDFLSAFSRKISAGDLGMVVVESQDTLSLIHRKAHLGLGNARKCDDETDLHDLYRPVLSYSGDCGKPSLPPKRLLRPSAPSHPVHDFRGVKEGWLGGITATRTRVFLGLHRTFDVVGGSIRKLKIPPSQCARARQRRFPRLSQIQHNQYISQAAVYYSPLPREPTLRCRSCLVLYIPIARGGPGIEYIGSTFINYHRMGVMARQWNNISHVER